MYFQTAYYTGTVSSATSTTCTLAPAAAAITDYYNGWVLEISAGTGSGQTRLIVDYDVSRITTVHKAWDTTPDNTSTYKLYKRFMKFVSSTDSTADENITLDPNTELLSPLKIIDTEAETVLQRADRTEAFINSMTSNGDPTSYYYYDNQIVFDYSVAENRWFKLEYIRILPNLTLGSDVPLIPEQFHDAIVLYAYWWGLMRSQEDTTAYSIKRNLIDLMNSLATAIEYDYERENQGLTVQM